MRRKKLSKAYGKRYRKEHKAEVTNVRERFLEKNPDYFKDYYEEHKDKIKEQRKEYYETNKEKIKQKYKKQRNEWRRKKAEELRKQGITNPWCVIRGMEPKYASTDTNSQDAV